MSRTNPKYRPGDTNEEDVTFQPLVGAVGFSYAAHIMKLRAYHKKQVAKATPFTIVFQDLNSWDHYFTPPSIEDTDERGIVRGVIEAIQKGVLKSSGMCSIRVPGGDSEVVVIKASLNTTHGRAVFMILSRFSLMYHDSKLRREEYDGSVLPEVLSFITGSLAGVGYAHRKRIKWLLNL